MLIQPEILPQYRCHKVVRAAKILAVLPLHTGISDPANAHRAAELVLDLGGGDLRIEVSAEFFVQKKPEAGQWFVVYEDGYQSVSPDQAFVDGYTAIATEMLAGSPSGADAMAMMAAPQASPGE